jgi:hypothetical protein
MDQEQSLTRSSNISTASSGTTRAPKPVLARVSALQYPNFSRASLNSAPAEADKPNTALTSLYLARSPAVRARQEMERCAAEQVLVCTVSTSIEDLTEGRPVTYKMDGGRFLHSKETLKMQQVRSTAPPSFFTDWCAQ